MEGNNHDHKSTLDQYTQGWLNSYRQRNYSPLTIRIYGQGIRSLVSFLLILGIRRIQEISATHLEAYQVSLQQRQLALSTLYCYLRSVRYFFAYLERQQHIFIDPARDLRLPRPERALGHVPSEEEVVQLLEQPDTATPLGIRDRAILETSYSCGLRRQELHRLGLADLNLDSSCLRIIGKGDRERIVPLGKQARRWLKQYLETARQELQGEQSSEALWLSYQGSRLGHHGISRLIEKYSAKMGKELSIHALRRACATHMLRKGAHPVQIQQLLGHASLNSLRQYLQVSITDMKKMHQQSRVGQ